MIARVAFLLVALMAVGALPRASAQEMGNVPPAVDAEEAHVYRRCTRCHNAENFHDKRYGWIGWELVLLRMQFLNGARFEPGEWARIRAYLLERKRAEPIWEFGEVVLLAAAASGGVLWLVRWRRTRSGDPANDRL
ncbi:MAG: hypothetical protein IT565_01875 [Rhodospirillales bacterium]|nr:hypothetical protein [Rhodospirillales bacterium]